MPPTVYSYPVLKDVFHSVWGANSVKHVSVPKSSKNMRRVSRYMRQLDAFFKVTGTSRASFK